MDEEQILLHHGLRDAHPLALIETRRADLCDICYRNFTSGEGGYRCSKKCGSSILLHEECAEMPRGIVRHPTHRQHVFTPGSSLSRCAICEGFIRGYIIVNFAVMLSISSAPSTASNKNANAADDENIIQFPINDVHEELIKPFVVGQGGEMVIPHDDEIINDKYWFEHHHH